MGPDHPLVHVSEGLAAVAWQSLAVASVLAASVIALAAGAGWAPGMAASSGVVLLALGAVGALLRQRGRDPVLALIAGGREDLPLDTVERERHRLLDRRTRSCLAASFESLVEEAANPQLMPGPRLFDPVVVGSVADELQQVAALLRDAPSSARGIALAWWLLSDGVASPLHRRDVGALREELGRICHLLSAGGIEPRGADRPAALNGGSPSRERDVNPRP